MDRASDEAEGVVGDDADQHIPDGTVTRLLDMVDADASLQQFREMDCRCYKLSNAVKDPAPPGPRGLI